MKSIVDIWVNCPTIEDADHIANSLIDSRLVACSNRYPEIASQYRWKGKVESASEIPLLLKTRGSLQKDVESAVRELHPYATPSILTIFVDYANEEYAEWIYAETEEQ